MRVEKEKEKEKEKETVPKYASKGRMSLAHNLPLAIS
jgi:hypothetical protein